MYFSNYAAGIFVFAGILSMIVGFSGISFTQFVSAQTVGEQIGNSLGGAIDQAGEAVGNVSQDLSGAVNETGQAADNATTADESASQAINNTASQAGQAARKSSSRQCNHSRRECRSSNKQHCKSSRSSSQQCDQRWWKCN